MIQNLRRNWLALWKMTCGMWRILTQSFKIGLKDISFHISRNSIGLYLSRECLLNFLSNFYIPPCVGKIFKFMEFTFLENGLIRGIFTHAPPQSKLAPKFLSSHPRQKEITHSPRLSVSLNSRKGGKKLWFALSNFSQKIWRWLETLSFLYFVRFEIFLNMMTLQFCK